MAIKNNKLIFIVILVVILLIITILAILYINTDFLKSNKKLFLKYMSQNIDAAKIVIDNKSEKEYTNLLKQNKYQSVSELNVTYTENINTSEENKNNDINKLKLRIDSQSEYMNKYLYKDINITYNNSNILKAEYLQDNEQYGIRFPNKFKQFLAVENYDLKEIANKASIEEKKVAIIPDTIEEYDYNGVLSFSDDELEVLKNKYLNIIDSNIDKDKYTKQKNVMITIGENSVYTNAYSLSLTKEQANDIYIKILEQLKTDQIIINKLSQMEPIGSLINLIRGEEKAYNNKYLEENYISSIEQKIQDIQQNNIGTDEVICTVYQIDGRTVRTQIIEELVQLTIDINNMDNDNIELSIQNKNINEEQDDQQTININKNANNEESKFNIEIEKKLGDTINKINFFRNKKIGEKEVNTQTGITYNDSNKNLLEANLTQNTELNSENEQKLKFNEENSVILNNYEGELITKWTNQVTEYLKQTKDSNQKLLTDIKKINIIKRFLNIPESTVTIEPTETTDIEKNRFNAKFEFYTGKEKKAEEVKKLIEEAKTSLNNAQVSYSNEGYTEGTKKLQSIKLIVEKDANKVELADSIKEMIEETATYTIEVEKNSNDLITAVNITVNK